jgi:hypothetical protein
MGDELGELPDRMDRDVLHQRGFGGIDCRHEDGVEALAAGERDHGQDAVSVAKAAVQTELAEEQTAFRGARTGGGTEWGDLFRCEQDSDGDRQVVGRASLAQVGGARLTVMRRSGKMPPLFWIAARTRSLASLTAAAGKPTMVNAGSPCPISTSTSTRAPSSPITAQVLAFATIASTSSPCPSGAAASPPLQCARSLWDHYASRCENVNSGRRLRAAPWGRLGIACWHACIGEQQEGTFASCCPRGREGCAHRSAFGPLCDIYAGTGRNDPSAGLVRVTPMAG